MLRRSGASSSSRKTGWVIEAAGEQRGWIEFG